MEETATAPAGALIADSPENSKQIASTRPLERESTRPPEREITRPPERESTRSLERETGAPEREPGARAQLFSAMIDRHARFLYRVAFTLMRNPEDAEDAVQDALLKLYRGEAWQQADDERAFLAQCVWRAGLTRLARAGAKAMRYAEEIDALQLASALDDPEQHAAKAEERSLMRRLILALPDALRQPLLLCAIDGMRSTEVATVLGIPEGTVRTRLMRARAELRLGFLEATTATLKPRTGATP